MTSLYISFRRLDKRSLRVESSENKRWKRTNTRQGEEIEKEPPIGTPKWALSDEWPSLNKERMKHRGILHVSCT